MKNHSMPRQGHKGYGNNNPGRSLSITAVQKLKPDNSGVPLKRVPSV